MNWPEPIRIVGVGSPQGDDAVGWELVRRLRLREWPGAVECYAIDGGQDLLDLLDGQGSLIMVDAVATRGSPGHLHRFVWPDARLDILRPGSTHHLQPTQSLHLAAALGILPPNVIVWGIEGQNFHPATTLSSAMLAAISALEQRIVGELELGHGSKPTDQNSGRNGADRGSRPRKVGTCSKDCSG